VDEKGSPKKRHRSAEVRTSMKEVSSSKGRRLPKEGKEEGALRKGTRGGKRKTKTLSGGFGKDAPASTRVIEQGGKE